MKKPSAMKNPSAGCDDVPAAAKKRCLYSEIMMDFFGYDVEKGRHIVHHEPQDFDNWPAENCSECGKPTRTWLTPHVPLCRDCACNMASAKDRDVRDARLKIALKALRDIASGTCCQCCHPGDPQCDVGIAKDALQEMKDAGKEPGKA